MEHLNGASMSDDRSDSCIIHCERMLEEIGDAEIHLNPDASLSALYSSIDFLIATLHESQVRREFTASQRKTARHPRLDIGTFDWSIFIPEVSWIVLYNGEFRRTFIIRSKFLLAVL